jgi:hypothetical protein
VKNFRSISAEFKGFATPDMLVHPSENPCHEMKFNDKIHVGMKIHGKFHKERNSTLKTLKGRMNKNSCQNCSGNENFSKNSAKNRELEQKIDLKFRKFAIPSYKRMSEKYLNLF